MRCIYLKCERKNKKNKNRKMCLFLYKKTFLWLFNYIITQNRVIIKIQVTIKVKKTILQFHITCCIFHTIYVYVTFFSLFLIEFNLYVSNNNQIEVVFLLI